ncbi:MAG TPA: Coq4 family protein [Myxococcota bacterium]|nr:Coq4 family protein [Myxococcota bacterium]
MSNSEPLPQSHHPIRPGTAFRALWRLALDNDDTAQVFKIVDALRGRSDVRSVERMRESEIGRAILAERRSLLDVLADRGRPRAMAEGSLGRGYLAFMEREGLTADGLAAASDDGYTQRSSDPDVRTFGDWARDSHDLWHVLTGYGRDPLGELCLLGVLYSQIRNAGTAFIALLGLLQVPFEYPGAPAVRAVIQGFWIGRRAQSMIAQDWEALLALPIGEVRAQLGLSRPTYYEQSAPLREAARSRSRAAATQTAAA